MGDRVRVESLVVERQTYDEEESKQLSRGYWIGGAGVDEWRVVLFLNGRNMWVVFIGDRFESTRAFALAVGRW